MRYVVDQNMMRHPDLADLARAESGSDFVLPDTAFVEMCKDARWEETMRRSLAFLSPVAHRVHGAMSYGHAMRRELETRRPTRGEGLLLGDHTSLARRIMAALAAGGAAFDELRAEIGDMRRRLLDEQADAVAEKATVKGLIDAFISDAGTALVANVRRPGPGGEIAVLALVQHVAVKTLCHMLVDVHGLGVDEMAEFVASKPLLLRHHIVRVRQAVRWIVDHGFEGVHPDRLLNDRLDHEYVVLGTYFDGVLTKDKGARMADRDLRILLDDVASAALRQAYEKLFGGVEETSRH